MYATSTSVSSQACAHLPDGFPLLLCPLHHCFSVMDVADGSITVTAYTSQFAQRLQRVQSSCHAQLLIRYIPSTHANMICLVSQTLHLNAKTDLCCGAVIRVCPALVKCMCLQRLPTIEAIVLLLLAEEDTDVHEVAAESAVSTAHVRLQDPILSISPHVTHLFTHHHPHRSTSAPVSHSLLSHTASGSEQHTNSIPDRLHPSDSVAKREQARSPQPVSSSPVPGTTPQASLQRPISPETASKASLQHASSLSPLPGAQGPARAQRQLFTSLSDRVRPSQPSSNPSAPPAQLTHQPGSSNLSQQQQGTSALQGDPTGEPNQILNPSLAEVYSRQRLFVCKMCRNPVKGLLCEPSSMQRIDYYQGNDMPLASFLAAAGQHKCLHAACGDGVTAHLRTFLHSKGRVTLSVSQTPAGKELPGSEKGQIWFWARPLQVC